MTAPAFGITTGLRLRVTPDKQPVADTAVQVDDLAHQPRIRWVAFAPAEFSTARTTTRFDLLLIRGDATAADRARTGGLTPRRVATLRRAESGIGPIRAKRLAAEGAAAVRPCEAAIEAHRLPLRKRPVHPRAHRPATAPARKRLRGSGPLTTIAFTTTLRIARAYAIFGRSDRSTADSAHVKRFYAALTCASGITQARGRCRTRPPGGVFQRRFASRASLTLARCAAGGSWYGL